MPARNKQIKERVTKMNNAWAQGAAAVPFKGITQTGFAADIKAAEDEEQAIADLEAQLKMRKTALDNRYKKLNEDSIKVRDGVEGHQDFGDNHPLYEAMGFVLFSNRRSGLTRKKEAPTKG
jgi:hypothetical protein